MLSAFTNSLKIPELRSRIVYTLSLLFIARVAAWIPLPGVNMQPLKDHLEQVAQTGGGSILAIASLFTGGALTNGAIGALGIMPYISASIIFQLMTAVVPSLSRLQQEGDVGRQKLTQYTRYATVLLCLIQGTLTVIALRNPSQIPGLETYAGGAIVANFGFGFVVTSVIYMTAGTMLLMWLGEQITQRGIGNGVSMLITVGILAGMPLAIRSLYGLFVAPVDVEPLRFPHAVLLLAFFIVVTMAVILIVQGQRKIPVQYAKRVVGNKVMGGQSSFLPLKVNYAGVMPVIFGSAILLFPQQIFNYLYTAFPGMTVFRSLSEILAWGTGTYYVFYGLLILFFSYFWVSVMFKPIQIADDLKKYGGYIPGVRPGEPTAQFLDFIMTRLTLAGAIFLMVIAVVPDLLYNWLGIPMNVSTFFGGTGMLITVGVILDTMRQVETHLLQRHYDGFLKKGRVRARSGSPTGMTGEALASDALLKIALPTLGLLVLGLTIWAYRAITGN